MYIYKNKGKMASGQIVAIKIPPYLKEYFVFKYGAEPIKAYRETKIFMFISRYLARKPKKWKPPIASDDTLLIELPYNEVIDIRTLCHIAEKNMPEIKTFIYGLFWGEFIDYMNRKTFKENWTMKYAIINFCNDHNMNWGKTNYDTLQKIYYRYRKPENQKIDEKNEEKLKKGKKFMHSGSRKKQLPVRQPSIIF